MAIQPIVLIDSATGSDTAASGAGPATALTGTAASTSADGLTVTLDGSPDLTNVLTDGTHVIWLNDTTANARNFAAIVAKDNVAKTVTVVTTTPFAFNLTGRSWAIGGRRASIGSTTSRRLVEQSTIGDWMPGWRCRFMSGHSETLTATLNLRRAGNLTDGPMYFEVDPNASVQPTLTWSSSSSGLTVAGTSKRISGFKLRNTNATKGSFAAIVINNAVQNIVVEHNLIGESGAGWANGIIYSSNNHGHVDVIGNEIAFCTTAGINLSGLTQVSANYIHDMTSHAIIFGATATAIITGNVLAGIGGDAVRTGTAIGGVVLIGNVIHSVTGNGLNVLDVTLTTEHVTVFNNSFSSVTGFGITWGASADAALFVGTHIRNNNFHQCTAGASSPSDLVQSGQLALDPQFVNAAAGNFTIGNTGLTSQAFPDAIGSATNHLGIGAIQPSGGGGSSIAFNPIVRIPC